MLRFIKTFASMTLFILFLVGCSSAVSTDFKADVNYSQFHTYEFSENANKTATSLDAARVKEALNYQLTNKGLRLVTDSKTDLTVKYYIQAESELQSYGSSVGFGYGFNNVGVGFSSPTQYKENRYGKLIVELIQNTSNQVIWRSISQRKLTDEMSAQSRITFINEQINEMFKTYPPQ
jgi:hypothetical protein